MTWWAFIRQWLWRRRQPMGAVSRQWLYERQQGEQAGFEGVSWQWPARRYPE